MTEKLLLKTRTKTVSFSALMTAIQKIHADLAAQANRAVNMGLTLRNWLIGMNIREYEQKGTDRARYGTQLMETLAQRLQEKGLESLSVRTLWLCRQFYLCYPHIWQTPSAESLQKLLPVSILQTLSAESLRGSKTPGASLIQTLSFSHIVELLALEDETQRSFYELECARGNWSVRELKRQIGSLYYERSGLSRNKNKLAEQTGRKAEKDSLALAIRDPFVFEFLGLNPEEVMNESQVESQIIRKLEAFLLELGHGFCFEARQKRILIGDEFFFIDLVFYHRILKCHVLVELKLEKFNQQNIGQLNTYVSWYRKNMMTKGDNPPVGILLCTDKNHALVEYALAGMDNNLFVSKYLLEMPRKEEMQRFMEERMKEML